MAVVLPMTYAKINSHEERSKFDAQKEGHASFARLIGGGCLDMRIFEQHYWKEGGANDEAENETKGAGAGSTSHKSSSLLTSSGPSRAVFDT